MRSVEFWVTWSQWNSGSAGVSSGTVAANDLPDSVIDTFGRIAWPHGQLWSFADGNGHSTDAGRQNMTAGM